MTTLPSWELPITPTVIVAGAIATRDFQNVHHDRDVAQAAGSADIFMNILTTTGFVQRYVTDQLGPDAEIKACQLRLGAPAYPGDTLVFSGTTREEEGLTIVDVVGKVSLGDHVTAKVTVAL
jgi:acyl dehydratase